LGAKMFTAPKVVGFPGSGKGSERRANGVGYWLKRGGKQVKKEKALGSSGRSGVSLCQLGNKVGEGPVVLSGNPFLA